MYEIVHCENIVILFSYFERLSLPGAKTEFKSQLCVVERSLLCTSGSSSVKLRQEGPYED